MTYTGAGNFTGNGNSLANRISGGTGADTLDGGAGNDTLTGRDGDDLYIIADTGDQIMEAADGGHDRVETSLSSLTLAAGVEDLIYTGSGSFAGTGNDLANNISGGGAVPMRWMAGPVPTI